MRDSIDFKNMDIAALFRKLLLPTVLGMIFSALFVITDGIFVGKGIGSDALAAVNIVAPLWLFSTGIGLMFGVGASVVASIHLSHNKPKTARINITQSIVVSSLLLMCTSTLFCLFAPQVVHLLGSSERLKPLAVEYMCWFVPFSAFTALLNSVMEGALSGKTGFTANAGYCYVGSLRQEDRTFVVALLACGWPNNKSYKWSDTKKLMSYGLENYTTHTLQEALLSSSDLPPVPVCDGAGDIWNAALSETPYIKRDEAFVNKKILLKQGEHFQVQYEYEKTLTAPVHNGQKIGEIRYYLDDTLYYKESIHVPDSIDAITLPYCIRQSIRHFLLYTST